MHVEDAIGTAQNVSSQANWRYNTDEAVINEINGTEQIYKRFQAPFGLY